MSLRNISLYNGFELSTFVPKPHLEWCLGCGHDGADGIPLGMPMKKLDGARDIFGTPVGMSRS